MGWYWLLHCKKCNCEKNTTGLEELLQSLRLCCVNKLEITKLYVFFHCVFAKEIFTFN